MNEVTRVYVPKGVSSHLLAPWVSPNSGDVSLCYRSPGFEDAWHGTGSQAEIDRAMSQPTCRQCAKIAIQRGYVDMPDIDGTVLTVETALGVVDVVAVRKVMSGIPCTLTIAEKKCLYQALWHSFQRIPAHAATGLDASQRKWDHRYVDAARGLGCTPKAVSDAVSVNLKRNRSKHDHR